MARVKGTKVQRAEKNRDAWIEMYAFGVQMHITHLKRGNYEAAAAVAAILEDARKEVDRACREFEDAH